VRRAGAASRPPDRDGHARYGRVPWPRFLLPALLLALWLLAPAGAQATTRPHYALQLSLSFAGGTADVVQKTSFRNNTGIDLTDVVFQVTPAFFDGFVLQSARVNGKDASASRSGTVLEIVPGSPLARESTTEVELRYRLQMPEIGGRFGRGSGIIALGNFFPVLAVYQDGWDRHQYVDTGDAFFTEVADFDVSVASDTAVTIAATAPATNRDGLQVFHAEDVRDFAMTISDRYQVRKRVVNGVQLAAYGPSASRLEPYLDAAEKSMRWYASRFGPYPYPSLEVAEIYADDLTPTAMEYPGLIMVYGALGADGGGIGSYSDYVVAHEVAHQWFYSLVGDDEVHDPWLDEALATYTDLLFLRDQAPASFNSYWQRNVAGYRARAAIGGDRPVNTTIYDYPNDAPYFDIVYRKGAVFLDKLRILMGDDDFFGLLRDYVQTYSDKIATPRALLDMAYSRVGPELPPMVSGYFSYGAFLDGNGYQLDVHWPDQLTSDGSSTLSFNCGFQPTRAKVWLDDRLLYDGPPDGLLPLSLDGTEEGEYVLRLDLLDSQGTLYQRAKRVTVGLKP
jgi:hypothetical protein